MLDALDLTFAVVRYPRHRSAYLHRTVPWLESCTRIGRRQRHHGMDQFL
ncbi:hypothetical protein RvY_00584 [Ramazzottius varieornatus]|uniref:Uncharacterized protein n=1 Tax=Ramazzottius varieornatus TaxID=947166 RepID=A0A1D1UDR8_RAMVA|nr:hypothetical protein RvY_00584 [Ramazzottius varieornatus]